MNRPRPAASLLKGARQSGFGEAYELAASGIDHAGNLIQTKYFRFSLYFV